jgi:heme oxygenase
LAGALRSRTAQLHIVAEQSGIVAQILTGAVKSSSYALYLRNLLPAYFEMEQALRSGLTSPNFGFLAQSALTRADRIEMDLVLLAGPSWRDDLPLLPSASRYRDRIKWVGAAEPDLLLAHAYTRYLGDLNGGQTLRRHLVRLFGAEFRATALTEFPAIKDIGRFAAAFRNFLDEAGNRIADWNRVLDEAALAFEMNIELSMETAALQFT